MADFDRAVAALETLARKDVVVGHEGDAVRVTVSYLDMSGPVSGAGAGVSQFEILIDFDRKSGEYRLTPIERGAYTGVSAQGIFGSGVEVTKTHGTVRSVQRQVGAWAPVGDYRVDFDSAPWIRAVTDRVEQCGWRPRRGFWRRFFA